MKDKAPQTDLREDKTFVSDSKAVRNWTDIDYQIVSELAQLIHELDEKTGCSMFSVLGSWKDTLPDNEVLDIIQAYRNRISLKS